MSGEGTHEGLDLTSLACSTSISALILSCSASYAALSGFPEPTIGATAGGSTDVAGAIEGGAAAAGEDFELFPFEMGALLLEALVDLGAGIWWSDVGGGTAVRTCKLPFVNEDS